VQELSLSLTISVKVACVQPPQLASGCECRESKKDALFSGMDCCAMFLAVDFRQGCG
jgi:hypothetical protein